MNRAHHRNGAGGPVRPDATRCASGHDLLEDGAVVFVRGSNRCNRCLQAKRLRGNQKAAAKRRVAGLHANCARCGVRKFEDRREVCFSCALRDRSVAAATPAEVDGMLTNAQLLESAPVYIKRDPSEHAAWLAYARREIANA